MRVILQEKIANLGNVGDQVKVKAGFARNFLLPKGKVLIANEANIAEVEKRREELNRLAAERLAAAKQRAEQFAGVVVTISAQASEEGKLYGSIGPREVAEAAVAAGHTLEKREVTLPEGPIRYTGEFDVTVTLDSDVTALIKVVVEAGE